MMPRNETATWDPTATDLATVVCPCIYCGGTSTIKVSRHMQRAWLNGANIQDVWPHISADQRETMITGYHSTCFDDAFKDDDDD
jgi:hypothetical protein